jgi:hypothetical protein
MQYMNDDNLDELFRRAANDYPLKTDTGGWGKVEAAVQAEKNNSSAEDKNNARGKYRKYLWLLLLLPIVWICNSRNFMNDSRQIENGLSSNQSQLPPQIKAESKQENKVIQKSILKEKNFRIELDKSTLQTTRKPKYGQNSKNGITVQSRDIFEKHTSNPIVSGFTNTQNSKIGEQTNSDSGNKKDKRLSGIADDKVGSTSDDTKKDQVKILGPKVEKNEMDSRIMNSNETKNEALILPNKKIDEPSISRNLTDTVAVMKLAKNDSLQKQIVLKPSKAASKRNKLHTLYAGIITGFDVSTVEFQSVKNTGFSAGALLGYQLTDKISIESGLLLDKKFYYTDGKYFSLKNFNIPATISILNANGYCYMFELPINIKYNWTSTSKSSWFSTIGLSSYFMKKEDYNYTYEDSGWASTGSKSYSNSATNWFGVINLSGGYTHTIGKTGILRVEPYLKVPLERLGIGSLSIWSSGVYISFVKNIFTK